MLKLAKEHPGFSKCGGVEYTRRIAEICTWPMHWLGLNDVTVCVGDAREFAPYESYDTFYFFNPFAWEIFQDVINKIPSHETIAIYYNPTCDQLVLDTGYFRLKKQLYDKDRDYYINIYMRIDYKFPNIGTIANSKQ